MATETTSETGPAQPTQPEKRKLTKQLPTDRIKVEKQFAIIRAFAAVSGADRRAVSNKQAAELVSMTDATLSLNNQFLLDIGVLEKADAGFVPSSEASEYKRAYELDDERAGERLGPLMKRTWFFEALRPKLEFQGLQETAAVTDLAVQCGAEKADLPRVRTLIEYLVTTCVVRREDSGMLTLVRTTTPPPPKDQKNSNGQHDSPSDKKKRRDEGVGAISFSIDVSVSMEELLTWDVARIAAFMDGVKGILRAKKGGADDDAE